MDISKAKKPAESELPEIISAVRCLVQGEPNLKCSTSDEFLIRFIKASNYDVKQSFKLVQNYFRSKIEDLESYALKRPHEYLSTYSRLTLGYVVHKPDVFGRRIVITKPGGLDPSNEIWSDLIGTVLLSCEGLSLEPDVQENGITAVLDCANYSMGLLKWVTPQKLKTLFRFLNICVPMRFEAYHVVNAPLIFNVVYKASRPFLQEDFSRKLKWHHHPYTELHKCIHPPLLPPNMGGTLEMDMVKDWHHLVTDKARIFAEIMKMGYTQ